MIRVAFIADIGLAGGATKSLVELVCTLRDNHDVEPIVITSQMSEMNETLRQRGIQSFAVGHGSFLQGAPDSWWKKPIKWVLFSGKYYLRYHSSIRKAMRCIDWTQIDLIHTNSARVDLGMELSRRTKIPNICHIREFAELDFNCWSYRAHYVKYLEKHVDGFIAISESVKKYWVEKGLSRDKITVIYNGVDAKKIQKADHALWENEQELRLVICGGVIPNKGQWQAIEALCSLPEDIRKRTKLDVVGGITATYRERISEPLKKLGMLDQVRFLGARNDVYEILKNYHVGLMCSKAEGFGRVTVEYMHAGLAVIASDTGANPELIENRVNGLLYRKDSTAELSQRIAELFNDRALLKQLAENGEKTAAEKYTREINAANVYQYYLKMAEK